MSRIIHSISVSYKVMLAIMVLSLLSNLAIAQDEKESTYILEPTEGTIPYYRAPEDDVRLGDFQEVVKK